MKQRTMRGTLGAAALTVISSTTSAPADDVAGNFGLASTDFTMIHSAWAGGWQWDGIGGMLRRAKAGVSAPDLPGHGSDKTPTGDISLRTYVEALSRDLDANPGRTILVAHSFGGVVASQLAEARPDKISAIVYLCAFMLPDGASFMTATEGVSGSDVLSNLVMSEDGKTVTVASDALHGALAHDVPAETMAAALPGLVAEPTAPLAEPVALSIDGYGSIPRYYVECTQDRAIPLAAQRAMYGAQTVEHVYSLDTAHMPMFSNPEGLFEVLKDIAGREYVRAATERASLAWKAAFNAGDAAAATALYEPDAIMKAMPFGEFRGHGEIEPFWRDLIAKGLADVEYFNTDVTVLNAHSARLTSQWRMNAAEGIITNEYWVLQPDGAMRLRTDAFEAQ